MGFMDRVKDMMGQHRDHRDKAGPETDEAADSRIRDRRRGRTADAEDAAKRIRERGDRPDGSGGAAS